MSQVVQSLFNLENRVALVTGGSRGIGYMIAQGLLEAGCKVYITARKKMECDAAADQLSQIGKCISIPGDIVNKDDRANIVSLLQEREENLDVLVNNAGTSWGESYENYPVEAFDKVFSLNVTALFAITRDLTPLLQNRVSLDSPSSVINIGSMDGLHQPTVDKTGTFAYTASKAAVHHMTRQLALELGPKHIRVNAIAPGYFASKMTSEIINLYSEDIVYNCPLGRLGEASDMIGTALFLSARAGAYVNGAVLPVDGGTSINHQHRATET